MPSTTAAEPSASSLARFTLRARAEPAVMPRVLELFAKRGLVPRQWHSATFGAGDAALRIDLEIGIAPEAVEYVANCMRGIVGMETVLATAD